MDPIALAIAIAVYLFAGFIKGVIGLGLPTIGLGLMTLVIGVEQAMILILWPAFLTNLWQGFSGGSVNVLVRRLWPFLTAASASVWVGTLLLVTVPEGGAELVLGMLMIVYSGVSLAGWHPSISTSRETVTGVIIGLINGVFSGLTGSYTVPGVMYLQALGLGKDEFVQAMGLLFLVATVALAISLSGFALATRADLGWSLVMVAPALTGVYAGQRLRRRISEDLFRKITRIAILALGVYLCIAASLLLT